MYLIIIHKKYVICEECANKIYPAREIDIEEYASSKSSYACCVSSNMDYDDLWQVTVVPSITSQTTFSTGTMVLSTRTLSKRTVSEWENKQDVCLPLDGNEKKKNTFGNVERSKIISPPPTCQKLSHDYPHCSFKTDTSISMLHGNKKDSHDRTKDKINKEDTRSQICKDMNNASVAPFIELGSSVYKILDFIRDYDSKVSLLTNNCYNEISRTLQCLLAKHHKKLEDLLSNDSSLHKCEHCGVISCMLDSHPTIKKIKSSRARIGHNDEAAERDYVNNDQKPESSINPSNLNNNARSGIDDSKIKHRTDYKDQLSEMELLPIKERAFIMKRYIESLNEANNISTKASINTTIKNKFSPDNNTIRKLFTELETEKKNERCESNSVARNNPSKYESSNEVKISHEPKSQSNDLLAKDRRSNIAQKIETSQRLLDKHGNIYPVIDTVKYLARGQFTELDKKENELVSKLQETRYTRPDDAKNGRSSVLYGSREDHSQRDAGFWLFDESGHLPQIALGEYRYLPMPSLDNNRENVSFPVNVSRYSHTVGKITDCSKYMEKDSLEDCTFLKRRGESNATIFSSSSVENFICGSLDRKCEINNIDDEDIPRGRKLVSSRPSLDIARHVRAQIAKDRRSGNAKESIGELYTRDSNILVRLSPETRRKIYHLIQTIVSDKDPAFFRKKYLMNDVRNSEKLPHSKSADAASAHSNKTYNEIINICADDCIPTKLADLSEGKNRLRKRRDNFINICNQDLNKSKDSVKIRHENSIFANNPTKKIIRQIIYKDALLKNVIGNNDGHVAGILPIYCKILENSANMDWEDFREFVEVLHPDEKELWRDVCRIVNEEAGRVSGDAEICIEISPVNFEEKTGEVMRCGREIVLDMTLKDIENFLNKRFRRRAS